MVVEMVGFVVDVDEKVCFFEFFGFVCYLGFGIVQILQFCLEFVGFGVFVEVFDVYFVEVGFGVEDGVCNGGKVFFEVFGQCLCLLFVFECCYLNVVGDIDQFVVWVYCCVGFDFEQMLLCLQLGWVESLWQNYFVEIDCDVDLYCVGKCWWQLLCFWLCEGDVC